MSPVFLLHHAAVLAAGAAAVVAVKAAVAAAVSRALGVPARAAWASALTLAHAGEFAFVLLSVARQLELLPETVRGRGGEGCEGVEWQRKGEEGATTWAQRAKGCPPPPPHCSLTCLS